MYPENVLVCVRMCVHREVRVMGGLGLELWLVNLRLNSHFALESLKLRGVGDRGVDMRLFGNCTSNL